MHLPFTLLLICTRDSHSITECTSVLTVSWEMNAYAFWLRQPFYRPQLSNVFIPVYHAVHKREGCLADTPPASTPLYRQPPGRHPPLPRRPLLECILVHLCLHRRRILNSDAVQDLYFHIEYLWLCTYAVVWCALCNDIIMAASISNQFHMLRRENRYHRPRVGNLLHESTAFSSI